LLNTALIDKYIKVRIPKKGYINLEPLTLYWRSVIGMERDCIITLISYRWEKRGSEPIPCFLAELHARGEGIYTVLYLFTIHRLGSEGGAGTFQLCLVESIVLEAVLFIVLLVEAAVRLVAAHGSQVPHKVVGAGIIPIHHLTAL